MDFLFVMAVVGLASAFVLGGLLVSYLVAAHRPGGQKSATYECGEEPIGAAWVQFSVGYYLFALLFLVFDVEAAFLFPWALVIREFGLTGLVEVGVFILITTVGLVYAWRKGALEWV